MAGIGKRGVDRVPIEKRFWNYVKKSDYCWIWTGGKSPCGYGRVSFERKARLAHRISFYLSSGRMPGPILRHSCDNPPCVRPEHLSEGTQKDNVQDALARGRIHISSECARGHSRNSQNTSIATEGRLRCRLCDRIRSRKRTPPERRRGPHKNPCLKRKSGAEKMSVLMEYDKADKSQGKSSVIKNIAANNKIAGFTLWRWIKAREDN
jgi:hypothetical protein